VLRVSGPRASELVRGACRMQGALPELGERGAFDAVFYDGVGEQPVLVLWMPGPRSFTREDVAEFHLPGNPHLVAVAQARLLQLGAEPAARGEFTRRAFLNGRLDLSRAEGVLALVQAEDEAERRAATALLLGGLEGRIEALRAKLDDLRALCEASLDFDQDDAGHVHIEHLVERLDLAATALEEARTWEYGREAIAGLPRIVLVGAPNAGKSTLYNRLTAQRDDAIPAIVDAGAGSTRDALEAIWTVHGIPCALRDTAGLDPAAIRGEADQAAQRRTQDELASADLVLWLVDASQEGASTVDLRNPCLVWTQIDRDGAPAAPPQDLRDAATDWTGVSARSGAGLQDLERLVAKRLGFQAGDGDASSPTREVNARHHRALSEAHDALGVARRDLVGGAPLDLVAEALRATTEALDAITGRTNAEDLLDRIFSRFCLGK
jgi:tRNA modification GTPase